MGSGLKQEVRAYFSASVRASSANSVMLLGSPTLLGAFISCGRWFCESARSRRLP